MFQLYLDGYSDTFEVSPSVSESSVNFAIAVKNSKKIDFERSKTIEFGVSGANVKWNDF